tara:strand:- start:364 stop:1665 length:1302 start_codon:yes stop_codon:yes gene_type:complete
MIKDKIPKNLRDSFAELTDEEVLFFIRIKGKKQYFNLFYPDSFLNEFKKISRYKTISEYKKDADVVIDFSNYKINDISTHDYDIIEKTVNIDNIIKRCRGLRAISLHEARELVLKCCKYFLDFYKSNSSLKLIIAGTVDNYVMDIMFQFSKQYSVNCIGITDFFLYPNYKLVTNYGEANDFHEPTNKEVESVLNQLLQKKESPLAISKLRAYKNAFKYLISYYYRYIFRYLYGYKLKGNISYEYRFAPFFKNFYKLNQLLLSNRYYDAFNKRSINSKRTKSVYIPLHWYPEATIDYWTDNSDKANYYESLFKVIRFFYDKKIDVILKEHPAFFLCREIPIYKGLKEFTNVTILDPFVKTQDLFDVIDNIVVWNGSTGVEALMLNKNVYSTTESYYSNNLIPHYTDFGNFKKFSFQEKKELIKIILKTSLKVNI